MREIGVLAPVNEKEVPPSSQPVYYFVVAGDTLYSIAKKHSLTVDQLMSMNNLQTNLIDVGVRLRVK